MNDENTFLEYISYQMNNKSMRLQGHRLCAIATISADPDSTSAVSSLTEVQVRACMECMMLRVITTADWCRSDGSKIRYKLDI